MTKKEEYKSALSVNPGVDQPPAVNPNVASHFHGKKKKMLELSEYVDGILNRNVSILSQAITLVESSLPQHHELGQQVIEKCLPYTGKSIRIGITGVPGVGKSTFIEALGGTITSQGGRLAVLAIDPSSERSKGSILGDKTRMETLCADPNAFIRPSPSAGSLGGVARKTRETIILCEAAGFNTIFIETVGVGQSETAVHSMVDFFLLLMLAGAGDELQGIKRGIMEMADLIAITKADGENVQKASAAKVQYESALHLFPPAESGWAPRVRTCSSVTKEGIQEVWNQINDYVGYTKSSGYFTARRLSQSKYWMYQSINETLRDQFYTNKQIAEHLEQLEKDVLLGKISSFAAAKKIIDFSKHIPQNPV
ncbi:MAG TPA: methylmalonyl Co-A mutase-associated GTPase MeaB [Tenuifilaceae bacterium]|nr:methylmalonyl Co-A mutase-associated GTPase MeaB [Tenuifilaceae bacterium]HPJ45634.1 methylmalonyl Co-A mutase-associated GTPase MeaB [Tenuifilaceae bacterium]HPQ35580.1 methylmalonyl Co-A mutase-associated GTPase MeaB [Tenuifilaceae bacterium]HRX67225.1 methylmalonyl Co-A mutase-associated GTPase MeaB [Tenuifilaceae bacterium]